MQWLAEIVALFGAHGAYANASGSLAEEREVGAQVDRFLLRFAHPAGGAAHPTEPAAGQCPQVA